METSKNEEIVLRKIEYISSISFFEVMKIYITEPNYSESDSYGVINCLPKAVMALN